MSSGAQFLPGAAAFAAAVVTMPIAKRIGRRFGIMSDRPSGDGEPVPVFGGASIVAAILIALAAAGALSAWIAAGALLLWLAGLTDDAIVLTPMQKLAGQFVAALVVVLSIPPLALTPWTPLNLAMEVVWLLASSNAFNLVDGLDGLAAGLGIISSAALAATAIIHGDTQLEAGAIAVGAALAGFLVYNWHPASIIMGDAGALPVGLLLGAFALEGAGLATNSHLTKYVFPVLVMVVPLLDTAIVSVTRLATGNPPSRRGMDHSHNRLRSLGLSEVRTAAVSWTVAALGALCAIAAGVLPHSQVLCALPFIVLAGAVIAMFMMDLTFDASPPSAVHGGVHRLARFILSLGYKRRIAEAVVDLALISAAYLGAWLIRLDFHVDDWMAEQMVWSLPWVLLATYAAFLMVGIYRGIWRYTGLSDGIRFANGAALAGIFIIGASMLVPVAISGSVLVLFVIIVFNLLIATRLSFQALRKGLNRLASPGGRVMVVGAGTVGEAAASYLLSGNGHSLRVIGFVDDDGFKRGKLVHGQRVLGSTSDLEEIYRAAPFDQLLIASDEVNDARVAELQAFAASRRIAVRRFLIQLRDVGGSAPAASLPNGTLIRNPGA
jgi:UDP-GlcNAc:undecaprenyl-phosphate/decaprenyl-phosphate GlcNAc-1-phosphate transferase